MEANKSRILGFEEEAWRLKIWVIWMSLGDHNTILFHNCANQCIFSNTIWEITTQKCEKCLIPKRIEEEARHEGKFCKRLAVSPALVQLQAVLHSASVAFAKQI